MQKKRLLTAYPLEADAQMLEKAASDCPVQEKSYYGARNTYQYDIHINCQVKEGILMAGFYFTRDLRLGARKPMFELLIDRENENYKTWDFEHGKWKSATLEHLGWPRYFGGYRFFISEESNRIIKEYLGKTEDGETAIRSFQWSILEKRLEKRHRKETDAWDKELSEIPKLPKDWDMWADRQGMQQHYLFYEYSRKKKQEGYCTWCGQIVPIAGKPKHNKIGVCRRCHHKIQFKARGRAGKFSTEAETAYLIQPCSDKFVLRQFKLKRWYSPGQYENPYRSFFEERRVLYDQNWNGEEYYYGTYKNGTQRWIKGVKTYGWFWNCEDLNRDYRGVLYRRNLPGLKKTLLGRTGLPEMGRHCSRILPDQYLREWKRFPLLEQLAKAGFFGLIHSVLDGAYNLKSIPSNSLAKSLGLDRGRLQRLKEHQGGYLFLEWLKFEMKSGRYISDQKILWFQECDLSVQDLSFILDRMSPERIYNYLTKQCDRVLCTTKELVSTWRDYLNMAKALRLDTQQEIFFKPKDIIASHHKMIEKLGGRNTASKIWEMEEKYPKVDAIYPTLKDQYAFEDERYRIIVPDGIREIIREGTALKLCVTWSGIYFERIERQETYLFFLRKKEQPDVPFYLLEVEPGGTIRQKRTYDDEQTPEIEEAKHFLKKWQRFIQKNMTKEDNRLAQMSAELRAEELMELRKKQSKIWHGSLRGKLLADILEADLMEAAFCAEAEGAPLEDPQVLEREAA